MNRFAVAISGACHRPRPGIVALLVAALLLLVLSHPLIHGDGVSYLVYLDSIAGDGDLDLSNQVEIFAPAIVYPYATSKFTGTPVTPFPFGSAYLLAPFYWLGRALEPAIPASNSNSAHFTTIQGLPLAYSLTATLGSLTYALAAVGLAYATARRLAPGWAAGLGAIGCLAGTPLIYYAAVEPLDAHVYGAFALALALWLAIRTTLAPQRSARLRKQHAKAQRHQEDTNYSRYLCGFAALREPLRIALQARAKRIGGWTSALATGLALGLAVLVRWQLLLYALPIGAALVWQAGQAYPGTAQEADRPLARAAGAGLAFAAGLGLYCGICALYFWRFFGAPLIIPNDAITGSQFVSAPLRYLPQVLFARHNGWLSWSPIAALGLAGLVGIATAARGWRRALALAGLIGIALQLALNASTDDWYGGWSFGMRRMAEAYPLLVLGVAWLIGRGGWRRWLAGAALLCSIYSLFLLAAHLYYTHTSGHPEGAGIAEVARWLLTGPHGPTPIEVFRDRYGPWAWALPEL